MLQDYTELISEARRKAQLSGRPLSEGETAGIARGYASEAGNRLFRMKQLALEELRTKEQLKAAKEARESEKWRSAGQIIGAGVGYYYGGPAGAFVGAGVGGEAGEMIGGSTWLCTETKKQSGLSKDDVQLLNAFRDYCKKHHKAWLEFYVRIGPEIVKEVAENENDVAGFYNNLKKDMVVPTIELTAHGQIEEAFELYKKFVKQFIEKYTPRHEMEAEVIDKVDKPLKEAA